MNIDIIIISSSITFLLGSIMFNQEMISRATALWILLGCSLALISVYLIDRGFKKKPDEPEPVDTMVGTPYLEDTKAPAAWEYNGDEEPQDDYWEPDYSESDEPQYDDGWY